jgi:hypothetical protein
MAALRTSGRRFFYEGYRVDGRDGAVERPAGVGRHELQADRAEQVAECLS